MVQINVPAVTKEEVKKLAADWKYGNLVVNVDDVALQFATDVSNFVLRIFLQQMQQLLGQAQNQAAQQVQSQAVPVQPEANVPQTLIVEG